MSKQKENPRLNVASMSLHQWATNLARSLARVATDSYDVREMVNHYGAITKYHRVLSRLDLYHLPRRQKVDFLAVGDIVPGRWNDTLASHQSVSFSADSEEPEDGFDSQLE